MMRHPLFRNWWLKLVALVWAIVTWWSVHRILPPHS